MRTRLLPFLALGAAWTAPPTVAAQDLPPVKIEQYRLPNGLKVILLPDHSSQVVAVDVWYNVGARNEQPGRTGFAHLFEHMMFQGSAHVKKAEHFQLVERAGGQDNGSTHSDYTNYFEVLPSNRLSLGLWLEADRMRSLIITDSNFHNQREAVKEERRLRVENQPYAGAFVEGLPLIYDSVACYGYAHPGIGWMKDLDAAQTSDVKGFFELYYAPNNATLALVGDFDPASTKELIAQYFGTIPRGSEPPAVDCRQGFGTGIIRRTVVDSKANLPAVILAYRVPPAGDSDTPSLQLLAVILGQGESSRLNRVLARERKAVVTVQSLLNDESRAPATFIALAIANQGVTAETVDTLLQGEVGRISLDGVTPAELEKAKNSYLTDKITARQSVLAMAESLLYADLFNGGADAVNKQLEAVRNVTIDDIRRVARKYLVPGNALALTVTPGAAQ